MVKFGKFGKIFKYLINFINIWRKIGQIWQRIRQNSGSAEPVEPALSKSGNKMSQIKIVSLELIFQKLIALVYFIKTVKDYANLKPNRRNNISI